MHLKIITLTILCSLWLATNWTRAIKQTHIWSDNGFLEHYSSLKDVYPENVVSLSCGGIIDLPSSGNFILVEYKASENYNNNERCLWTLNNISGSQRIPLIVTVTLTLANFPDDNDGVSLIVRNRTSLAMIDLKPQEKQSHSAEMFFLSFTSNESAVGHGFIIQIDVIRAGGSYFGKLWSFTAPFNETKIAYGPYKEEDRISIAINPLGLRTTFTLDFLNTDIENTDNFAYYDVFLAYEIADRRLPLDSLRIRLSGNFTTTPASFKTTDSILVLFLSVNPPNGKGFEVSWT